RRLVREEDWHLTPWYCGLPSTTPAVQAAILFGNREDIPGFRWYDKREGLAFVAKRPAQVQALQERLKAGRVGILVGGSSYVNMFDGDADLALFTLSSIHPRLFLESVRGIGLLLIFLLSPLRVLRVLWLTVTGYLRALIWRLRAVLARRPARSYGFLSPLLAAAVNALFTEVQTFGIILDIYRGVPSIYANYNAYDEVAHWFGPDDPAAFGILRDIDRRVRQIDRARRRAARAVRSPGRRYDLFVLSDHGNAPAVPFSWRVGQTLGEFVAAQLGGVSLDEVFSRPGYAEAKARYLMGEMEGVEERLPPAVGRVVRALRRSLGRRIPPDPEAEEYDLERREDVVVRVSGPLAHIYFNVISRPLDLIEVALLYPHLLDRLMEMDLIGWIVGRAGEQAVVLGREGGRAVIGEGGVEVTPPDPLSPYGDRDQVAREVYHLATSPHAGDLILMGGLLPDGRVVTFEEQVATHGGLGGGQEWPFLLCDAGGPVTVASPAAFYDFFLERYFRTAPAPQS
ncbi:MAG: alkaline phosphatase family protein, partial [Thermoflexales bacterium]|nr:alkaline phosphatase family protein [Thermoflexales bacterium]